MRLRLALLCSAVLFASPALAQVRVAPNPGSLIDPASEPLVQALFGQGGYFMIAGGVVLGGRAQFVVDQGSQEAPVPSSAVQPAEMPDGTPALSYQGALYPVRMPAGLACPLAKFTARDGIVAYTIPKFVDEDSRQAMMRVGLRHHRIAKEFDHTPFEPLLRAADFAASEPLAPAIAQALTQGINRQDGDAGYVLAVSQNSDKVIGSLINTDAQVVYRVHLMPATHTVEIEGVPLRYYWQLQPNGTAAVFAVDELSQNWPAGTTLTNYAVPGAKPGQYDVINFYQVGGLFREMHMTHEAAFSGFVAEECK